MFKTMKERQVVLIGGGRLDEAEEAVEEDAYGSRQGDMGEFRSYLSV